MNREDLEEHMMVMDGYDDCVIGIAARCGQPNVLAYSYEKVIDQLIKEGMSEEEAIEWFEYNMVGSYVGEGTPIFIYPL